MLAFRRVTTPIAPLGSDKEPGLHEIPIVSVVEGGRVARQVPLDGRKQLVGHDGPFEFLIELDRPQR